MSKWYVGIDLGTTNSALSTCRVDDTGDLNATAVKLKRKARSTSSNNEHEEETLPSCVQYKKDVDGNYNIIVGDYAKEQFSTRPDTVAKSIKTQMGNPSIDYPEWDEEIPDKTPEEVSSRILKHMMEALKRKKRSIDDDVDVVITIPASFSPIQRMATLKAAELAGINVKNADGSYNGRLLLSEPDAVMYHLINSLNEKKTDIGIDFDVPKNILIFDIGGGTLDVTVHQVERVENSKMIKMKQLSINKYTAIAGDVFDKTIAKFLVDQYGPDTDKDSPILLGRAMTLAEELKKEINQAYKDEDGDIDLDEEFEGNEDLRVGRFERSASECSLTRGEFEDCLSELMANDLVYDDYKRLDEITNTDNIIYPILYALSEAEKKAHKENIPFDGIDAVVLNGGMSKLYLIEERLQKFFGQDPITEVHPDLSVAQGAAVYNYYLHHEENAEELVEELDLGIEKASDETTVQEEKKIAKTTFEPMILSTSLLPNGLYIGYKNGTFEQIAEDNADLPLVNDTITGIVLEGQREIYVPIYVEEPYNRGTKDKNGKTYKKQIASGKININLNLKKDCYVTLTCSISKDQILSINAIITSDYYGSNILEKSEDVEIIFGEIEGTGKDGKLTAPAGKDLNVNNEISSIVMACNNLHKAKKNRDVGQQEKYKKELDNRTKNIKNAGNIEEFSEAIIKVLLSPSCDEVLYNLLPVAHFMCASWSDKDKASLLRVAYTILDSAKIKLSFQGGKITDTQYSKIINFAIQIVGKIGDEKAADKLNTFLPYFEFKSYVLTAFSTLGIEYETVYKEFLDYQYSDMFARGILWAVGNCFKKSDTYGYKVSDEKMVAKLIFLIQSGELKLNELRCAETSMALICDKRPGTINQVSDVLAEKALSVLENIDAYYERNIVAEQEQANIIARKIIKGEILGWNEETVLKNNTDRLFDKSIGGENEE